MIFPKENDHAEHDSDIRSGDFLSEIASENDFVSSESDNSDV